VIKLEIHNKKINIQENNREKGKDKDSYVSWSTDNRKLLILLVDAINRG